MRSLPFFIALIVALAAAATASPSEQVTYRIDHVTDGDTVVLRNGQRVRLVQIDTPEVFFGSECYGPQASATTKRLLPPGTRVRLLRSRRPIASTTSGGSCATSSVGRRQRQPPDRGHRRRCALVL